MSCTRVDFGNGVVGIVCTRGRRSRKRCSLPGCANHATLECDGPVNGRTCDALICVRHRTRDGDLDLCPECARDAARQPMLWGV